jgi:2,3-diaminopropionate biosynthesis protein SbnB
MNSQDLVLVRGEDVAKLLAGREAQIVEAVRAAYVAHAQGDTSIPNCPFLRFPKNETDRIIPKPAFLGGEFQVAGIKWVASFPGNLAKGLERASATIILNSTETGRPVAIIEGSLINAYRTAASAALAADVLRGATPAHNLVMVGCGLINFETLRFLLTLRPEIRKISLVDLNPARAAQFLDRCQRITGDRELSAAANARTAFQDADIVSLATTASKPHLDHIANRNGDGVVLHISLRDLTPAVILAADNVVDDVEHVCSNRTSLDLTVQQCGSHDFIRTTLGAILLGREPARRDTGTVIFSPFGLGILDLAVGHLVYQLAVRENAGLTVGGFVPPSWLEEQA